MRNESLQLPVLLLFMSLGLVAISMMLAPTYQQQKSVEMLSSTNEDIYVLASPSLVAGAAKKNAMDDVLFKQAFEEQQNEDKFYRAKATWRDEVRRSKEYVDKIMNSNKALWNTEMPEYGSEQWNHPPLNWEKQWEDDGWPMEF